jgi:hypothetical protein
MLGLGFRKGRVYMPGLGIEADIGANYYRHDGMVQDLAAHTNRVLMETGCVADVSPEGVGRCLRLRLPQGRAAVIYTKPLHWLGRIFNEGHESAHALRYLGAEQTFAVSMQEAGFDFDPNAFDEETAANFGGLLALYKANAIHLFHHPQIDELKRYMLGSQ